MLIKSPLLLVFLILPTTLLTSCLSAPECSLAITSTVQESANAGCLVVDNQQLLLVQGLDGKVSIPGGSAKNGESAACTAFRETWEETALHTIPIQRARRWPNGFVMFECQLVSNPNDAAILRPAEIKQVLWLSLIHI